MSTGLMSQLGAKQETTYGTRVVPDRFFEFRSESLARSHNTLVSTQLGAGTTFARSSRRAITTREGGGDINMEFTNKGMSFWLNLLHSATVTPTQQGGTTAYLHTHPIGLTQPTRSATIQVGRPSTDGTVRPFDYVGAMVTGYTFAWDLDDFLTMSLSFDARDEKTDQTLATRSIPTGLKSFNFTQGALTIGGTTVADVGGGSVSGGKPLNTSRWRLGSSGLKSQPILNGFETATGTLTADFTDLTHYNRFVNGTIAAVVLTFTGDVIAGAFNEKVEITMPAVAFDGETPNVDGPDMLSLSLPFTAFYNGTDAPVSIAYTTTDTTV